MCERLWPTLMTRYVGVSLNEGIYTHTMSTHTQGVHVSIATHKLG